MLYHANLTQAKSTVTEHQDINSAKSSKAQSTPIRCVIFLHIMMLLLISLFTDKIMYGPTAHG
jgi:hypothetical protein